MRTVHPLLQAVLDAGAVLAVAAMGLVCAPSAADAARFTYRSDSKRAGEVRAAVTAWNDSGARVRFVMARRGHRADLRFKDVRMGGQMLGETAGRIIKLDRTYQREYAHDPLLTTMGRTAAHEIGHFLGLPHNGRCSLMAVGGQDAFLDWCQTRETNTMVPCGPQRTDAFAAARRFGWRRGGRRRARSRGFGRCPYADGPSGTRFKRQWCGPSEIELRNDEGRTRIGSLAFIGQEWREDSSAQCRWYVIENHNANDNYFSIGLSLRTPSGVEPPWRYGGVTYPGTPAAGNCGGHRADTTATRYSPTRYLTAGAHFADIGPRWQPTGGYETLLTAAFQRAESTGVGLACADGRR